jgi:hypothetical protein
MHIWWGAHRSDDAPPWWSVKLAGDWRTYRRHVLWLGDRFIGVQAKSSPLPIISNRPQ